MRYVVFDEDQDPDFSWLEQSHYQPGSKDYSPVYRTRADMRAERNPIEDYANPETHIALQMVVYRGDPYGDVSRGVALPRDFVLDSLGGIDFLRDEDNWTTGTFCYVNDIPKRCRYQRTLAREAGLRYRPRVRRAKS